MPYIKGSDRAVLDPYLESLANTILALAGTRGFGFVGLLNYCCTRLGVLLLQNIGQRYWTLALVLGVYHSVADEFYRRMVAPYEEERKGEHGDVY